MTVVCEMTVSVLARGCIDFDVLASCADATVFSVYGLDVLAVAVGGQCGGETEGENEKE